MLRLIISTGDTNGIGLEVFIKSLIRYRKIAEFDSVSIELATNKRTFNDYLQYSPYTITTIQSARVSLIHCKTFSPLLFGEPSEKSSLLAIESLETAVSIVKSTTNSALVTLPIAKKPLQDCGWNFPGQTEFVSFHSRTPSNEMMVLTFEDLSFGLVTIHTALDKVASLITPTLLQMKVQTFTEFIENDLRIPNPKIAILGLNPHSGENGTIGVEEVNVLKPTIQELKSQGFAIEGPFPADSFFGFGEYKRFDGILAMYHDQGLIPAKMISGGNAVNITAGTSIVRTSPDHGVGYPIAGKWVASEESTFQAMVYATRILSNRLGLNY